MLVTATPDEATLPITAALTDQNPRVRATAARVANVRNLQMLLPKLRETLRAETNLEAAREQLRAIGTMGGPKEVDYLIEQADRLGPSFRTDALIAMARGDGPQALNAYFANAKKKDWKGIPIEPFLRAALWGHPALITLTASRALGAGDEPAWRAVLALLQGPRFLAPQLGAVALRSESDAIAADSAWYLATVIADRKTAAAGDLVAALDGKESRSEPASADLLAGREMLSRVLGRPAQPAGAFLRDLVAAGKAWRFGGAPIEVIERAGDLVLEKPSNCANSVLAKLLAKDDKRIVCQDEKRLRPAPPTPADTSVGILPPPFTLLIDLPKDVAAEVVTRTGCRDDWIGNVAATVDRSGRVTTFSLAGVYTSNECRRALEVLIPLTLADNRTIDSSFSTPGAIVVKSKRAAICVDESDVDLDGFVTAHRVGGEIAAPVVVHRVEPDFPQAARRALSEKGGRSTVIIESRISRSGCANPLQVVVGSTSGDLNRSALLAIAQWRFKPGTLDGKPVPVIFQLNINYKLR
ncbi:MAG: energy transducer TonB [Thermoanaerobaculia bacterium]